MIVHPKINITFNITYVFLSSEKPRMKNFEQSTYNPPLACLLPQLCVSIDWKR